VTTLRATARTSERIPETSTCGITLSTPPPGEYPRLAGLGDLSRLLTGEHAHHGLPPGVNWSWLAFPEA